MFDRLRAIADWLVRGLIRMVIYGLIILSLATLLRHLTPALQHLAGHSPAGQEHVLSHPVK